MHESALVTATSFTPMATTPHIRKLALTLAITAVLGPVKGQIRTWERERNGYWLSLTGALHDENPKVARVVGVEYDGDETGHALILLLSDGSVSIIDQLNEEEYDNGQSTTH